MKARFAFLLLSFAAVIGPTLAGEPLPQKCNAGIVLYHRGANGVEFLLADHTAPSQRGWAAFGGRHEGDETPAQTAARETEEETRGYFRREKLAEALQKCQPFYDGLFALYFLEVEHVPIDAILQHPVPPGDKSFAERGPYAWVPADEVYKALSSAEEAPAIDPKYLSAGPGNKWFWKVWIHNLRQAEKAGALPK